MGLSDSNDTSAVQPNNNRLNRKDINIMKPEFIDRLRQHNEKEGTYSQRDFVEHFSTKEAQDGLKEFIRRYSHKSLEFFHSSDDWNAFIPASFQSIVAEYGAVPMLPEGLITTQSEVSRVCCPSSTLSIDTASTSSEGT